MTAPPRKRDAAATTEAILVAAREVFTERGYDAAGTREIAERAQANVALINRYFGSKEGLFAAAVPPKMTLDSVMTGDMADVGRRIAASAAHKTLKDGFDPMIAMLRASSSRDAVPILRRALDEQFTTPLAARLTGPNCRERALMIGALIVGFDMVSRVLRLTEGADISVLERSLAEAIQRLVDPPQAAD